MSHPDQTSGICYRPTDRQTHTHTHTHTHARADEQTDPESVFRKTAVHDAVVVVAAAVRLVAVVDVDGPSVGRS